MSAPVTIHHHLNNLEDFLEVVAEVLILFAYL